MRVGKAGYDNDRPLISVIISEYYSRSGSCEFFGQTSDRAKFLIRDFQRVL